MDYTRTSLARLAYSAGARELADSLVSTADPSSDAWGRGAFLTEEANEIFSAARELLAAAVVADRLRGCSWSEIGEALLVTRQSAQERFVEAEREFRDAVLFPHRHPDDDGLGYTVAPYAVNEPDRVRERLDEWVATSRPSGPDGRGEPAPVTAGLTHSQRHATADRINDVLALRAMLVEETLPADVTKTQAQRRHAELNVDLLERIAREQPNDVQTADQLADARRELERLTDDQ